MMRFRLLFVFFVVCLIGTPAARGADILSQIHPYISVSEEYDDNVNLTASDRKDDFITTIQPGIKFSNMRETGGVDLDYNLGLVFYSRDSDKNYVSHNAQLTARYLPTEHLSLSVRESFTRSDEPREREYFTTAADNSYVLATENQRFIYWRNVVAPTIEYKFGPENSLGVNYRNNIYETQNPASEDSRENYISPFYTYWFDRYNGIHLEYGYTHGEFDNSPDLKGHRANARYTHRFGAKFSTFAEYTFAARSYDDPGTDYNVHDPAIGVTYTFTPAATASIQAGYYQQDPEKGSRTSGISYKGELTGGDRRTTYRFILQGGYKEDLFTAENLGFSKYHRLSIYATHRLTRKFSVGFQESLEKAKYDDQSRKDVIWIIGGNVSYQLFRWMALSLEYTHSKSDSTINANDYMDNRGMIRITATY